MKNLDSRIRNVVSIGALAVGLTFVSTALAANNQLCKGYCSSATCKPAYGELCCCCKIGAAGVWTCVSRKPTDCTTGNNCQT